MSTLTCMADKAFLFGGGDSFPGVADSKNLFFFEEQADGNWGWSSVAPTEGAVWPIGRAFASAVYIPTEDYALYYMTR